MYKLLIIDDDESQFFLIERALKLLGAQYLLKCCEMREEALEILKTFSPNLIICDYYTLASDIAIDAFVSQARKITDAKIVAFTGLDLELIEEQKDSDLARAAKMGVQVYLKKHDHLRDLKKVLAILEQDTEFP